MRVGVEFVVMVDCTPACFAVAQVAGCVGSESISRACTL